MQTVSFETAKRLKGAGFSQPSEIDPANRWLIFYVEPSEEGGVPELYSADRIEDIRSFSDPCEIVAYAATATDLIPPGWFLQNRGDDWICSNAFTYDGVKNELKDFINDNPAEAAAMAWLHVNRNFSNV